MIWLEPITLWKYRCRRPGAARVLALVAAIVFAVLGITRVWADSEDNTTGQSAASQAAHATITEYRGPETCVGCYEAEAREMHGLITSF